MHPNDAFANPCTSDKQWPNYVSTDNHCYAINHHRKNPEPGSDVLILFGGDAPAGDTTTQVGPRYMERTLIPGLLEGSNANIMVVMRPQECTSFNNTSLDYNADDQTKRCSTGKRPMYGKDSYTEHTARQLGAVTRYIQKHLKSLGLYTDSSRVFLGGHSGGANLAILISVFNPGLASGVLAVAPPCDLDQWTKDRGFQNSPKQESLSVVKLANQISIPISLVVASNDDNTRDSMVMGCHQKFKNIGVPTSLTITNSGGHVGVLSQLPTKNAALQLLSTTRTQIVTNDKPSSSPVVSVSTNAQ